MKKLIVFAVAAVLAVSAFAQGMTYGWRDSTIPIGGQAFDITLWSTDSANGTNLGTLDLVGSSFEITAVSLNIWSESQDRDGANLILNSFVNGSADAAGQDTWLGELTHSTTNLNNYSLSFATPITVGDTTALAAGDVVGIDLWAKTYGTSGDQWYSANDANYHAYFTVGTAPVPEPATMSLLGLGALAMVLRRKLRK